MAVKPKSKKKSAKTAASVLKDIGKKLNEVSNELKGLTVQQIAAQESAKKERERVANVEVLARNGTEASIFWGERTYKILTKFIWSVCILLLLVVAYIVYQHITGNKPAITTAVLSNQIQPVAVKADTNSNAGNFKTAKKESPEENYLKMNEIAKRAEDDANAFKTENEKLKKQLEDRKAEDSLALAEKVKDLGKKVADLAASKQTTNDAVSNPPPNPAKEMPAVVPATKFVNLIRIAYDGHIMNRIDKIPESDVVRVGEGVNFELDGKPNNWPTALISISFTDGPPIIGKITCTAQVYSKTKEVIVDSASACDVYEDDKGHVVLYEYSPNNYVCPPPKSGFTTR